MGTPIPGYFDLIEQLTTITAFAAVAYAERLGAHIRMNFLPNALPYRARAILEALLCLVGALTVAGLVYASWFSFIRSLQLGQATMDLRIPVWPSKLLLLIALGLLLVRLILKFVGYLLAARPSEQPQ